MEDLDVSAKFEHKCSEILKKAQNELDYTGAIDIARRVKKIKNAVVAEGEMSYEEGLELLEDIVFDMEETIEENGIITD